MIISSSWRRASASRVSGSGSAPRISCATPTSPCTKRSVGAGAGVRSSTRACTATSPNDCSRRTTSAGRSSRRSSGSTTSPSSTCVPAASGASRPWPAGPRMGVLGARGVHLDRRGDRADRSDRHSGTAYGAWRSGRLAAWRAGCRRRPYERQRLWPPTRRPNFPRTCSTPSPAADLPGELISLEITETTFMREPERISAIVVRNRRRRAWVWKWTTSEPATRRWRRCTSSRSTH